MVLHRSDTNDSLRAARRSAGALVALCAVCFAPAVRGDTTSVTFAAQQTLATGAAPHSVELADLNADGRLDLIVTNQDDDTVSVLLNTTAAGAATPTFAAQQTLATGSGPAAAIAADINGDGKSDIVVANAQSATVSVLFNDTAADAATVTFTAQQTFPTAQYPFDVAATDIDGDGKLDLIVANAGSTVVSVLRNTTAAATTTASFVTQSLVPVGRQPAALAVADFNADGRPDFAVVNFLDNTVSLLLNTTAAGSDTLTFAAQTTQPTGVAPSAVAVADINADGKPDIVTVDAFDNKLSVLLNTTAADAVTPTFAARTTFVTEIGPAAVKIADINGDGRPDLVVPAQAVKFVSVFVNTTAFGGATPAFAARQNFATGTDPVAAAVTDLNADGKPDVIVANNQDKTLSLLLNTSAFDGINLNQHGLTGSWFNPATPGQGIELELYPDFGASGQGIVFGGWFTFDVTAAGGQRWYALQGAISSTNPTAQLGIYAGYGGNFAAAPAIDATQVGSATLRFTTCNTGILTYQFDDGRSGTIALARLTTNVTCSANGDNGTAASSYLLSGSWYDAGTSGQGLVFDINPLQNVFFAGWYTYAPDGAQTGGAASERWYVIQADFPAGTTAITGAPIYAGTGGVFDDPQATTVSQVGTADIAFQSCAAATLTYTFTAGVNSGLTGTLNLTRTGPVPTGCSLSP